jgi:TetR/AcrR family transcriptional regulator, regulator of autoinduction and epiphytic fitness
VTEVVDGRVTRGQRNREAIADALLACYEAGELRPSVHEVARRAGVSARTVHNHFEDVEALRAEVARRQGERYFQDALSIDARGSRTQRVAALVASRAELYEAITPVRRAALLSVHESPTIAANLARLDRRLRRQLETVLPSLAGESLDAVDAALSWDTWNRLRAAQGCSPARARRVLLHMVTALLEGSNE